MTWLRTPPDAKPDAQAATPEGHRDVAVDVQDVTPEGRRDVAADVQDVTPEGHRDAAATPRPTGLSLGVVGWLRWGWRQLTSMRTALVLLFLLAAGSVPGSLLPQDGTNPAAVSQYYASHPVLAKVLGGLSLFNVFGAPWFAAIY